MKKFSTLNYILNKIIDNMPQDLNELEMAAYIMVKIANELSFSSEYYWGNRKIMKKIYSKSIKNKELKFIKQKQLICVTIARIFKEIADKFGLNIYFLGKTSRKITDKNFSVFENGEHIIPILKTENGKLFEVDLERNLHNIKTHRRWTNFCTNIQSDKFSILSREEIDFIMKKIGYINDEHDYLDSYCETLYRKIEDYSIVQKVNEVFYDSKLCEYASKLKSSAEIYRFYRRILSECTVRLDGTNEFNEKIKLFGGYSKNKNNLKRYILCSIVNDNVNEYTWIWSKNRMIEIDPKVLKSFVKNNKIKLKFVQGVKSSFIRFSNRESIDKTLINNVWIR